MYTQSTPCCRPPSPWRRPLSLYVHLRLHCGIRCRRRNRAACSRGLSFSTTKRRWANSSRSRLATMTFSIVTSCAARLTIAIRKWRPCRPSGERWSREDAAARRGGTRRSRPRRGRRRRSRVVVAALSCEAQVGAIFCHRFLHLECRRRKTIISKGLLHVNVHVVHVRMGQSNSIRSFLKLEFLSTPPPALASSRLPPSHSPSLRGAP